MIDLIVSEGRVADRLEGLRDGSRLTGKALALDTGRPARFIGTKGVPLDDHWTESLTVSSPTLHAVQAAVRQSLATDSATTVMVASTCPTSIASLPVVAKQFPDIAVLWIDAHADFNTPATTESGYLGGMVLSAACGLWDSGYGAGIDPRRVIVAGARDIDPMETRLLSEAGVTVFSPQAATPQAISALIGTSDVWIHIDWDVLEPGYVPAEYEIAHGLVPVQVEELLSCIPSEQIRGLELAEFLPPSDEIARAHAVATILQTVRPVTGHPASRDSAAS